MATKKVARKLSPITELHVALAADTSFEDLVKTLRVTLTIPELPGFRGCRPCLSGLDRFLIEDIVTRGMR
jgi:hypothetical protein